MSTDTKVTWRCDRCGSQMVREDLGFQPNDWCRVVSINPPKASHDAVNNTVLGDLCSPCRKALAAWMRPGDAIKAGES